MITLKDTLNKSRENEIKQKFHEYKQLKAKRLGLESEDDDSGNSSASKKSDRASPVKLTAEEKQIIASQCQNKGVNQFTINPKSISRE